MVPQAFEISEQLVSIKPRIEAKWVKARRSCVGRPEGYEVAAAQELQASLRDRSAVYGHSGQSATICSSNS
jgi:hypothetical protein